MKRGLWQPMMFTAAMTVALLSFAYLGRPVTRYHPMYEFVLPLTYLGCVEYRVPDGASEMYGWKFEQPVILDLTRLNGSLTIIGDIEFSHLDSAFCTSLHP